MRPLERADLLRMRRVLPAPSPSPTQQSKGASLPLFQAFSTRTYQEICRDKNSENFFALNFFAFSTRTYKEVYRDKNSENFSAFNSFFDPSETRNCTLSLRDSKAGNRRTENTRTLEGKTNHCYFCESFILFDLDQILETRPKDLHRFVENKLFRKTLENLVYKENQGPFYTGNKSVDVCGKCRYLNNPPY